MNKAKNEKKWVQVACKKCNGEGRILQFQHIIGGTCFQCWGKKVKWVKV